jgi:propanediol dehydratase small subunit
MADRLRAASGRPLADITVAACGTGSLRPRDIAIEAATLRLQAQVAREAGRPKLAENFERAAEMVAIPGEAIFEIYEKLRPGRARDAGDLLGIAARLRRDYGAEQLARLVEEAAAAYERRDLYQSRLRPGAE